MGANEIANRVEASAWIAAAGEINGEGVGRDVEASDFFFRSISGFVNRMEVIDVDVGDPWDGILNLSIALFLDRNYARKDTTLLLQAIDSFRPQSDDPAVINPLVFNGPVRVATFSAEGYESVKTGGVPPFTLPASLDPFSVLLINADLNNFQELGVGLEFGIELLRMPDNDGGDTAVAFVDAAP